MHTAADLALAQKHVDEAEGRIADQERLIFRLADGGHDTAVAKNLLRLMREILDGMLDHRDRIVADIASTGGAQKSN